MPAKKILRADKIVCTSRPNCPCVFCGRVRLLMAQESERITRLWDDQASEDQLALDYITQFERGKR
jgi:hypothetical protein